jgi:RNA polymerase sigma-70 factor, ECF subfamily
VQIDVLADAYVDHAPYVRRTLRRLGVAPADVDDLAHEVFVVVVRKLEDRAP